MQSQQSLEWWEEYVAVTGRRGGRGEAGTSFSIASATKKLQFMEE
jgi:hypothetical protein